MKRLYIYRKIIKKNKMVFLITPNEEFVTT